MIIAIDGLSGSGKGTLARCLRDHFRYAFLDTGLLYRAVGHKMGLAAQDLSNAQEAAAIARALQPQDLEKPDLRGDDAAVAASKIAVFPEVRQALLDFQRNFAQRPPNGALGAILDGRDIGTYVCPEADVKIYLTADVKIRAERRFKELQAGGKEAIYTSVLQDMEERDHRDATRKTNPLRPAKDAYLIDTTGLSVEAVVQKALDFINSKRPLHTA